MLIAEQKAKRFSGFSLFSIQQSAFSIQHS